MENKRAEVRVKKMPLLIIVSSVMIVLLLSLVNSIEAEETSVINRHRAPSSYSDTGGSSSFASTQSYRPSYQSSYSGQDYFNRNIIDPDDCFARQDFIIQVAPGGCKPMVVRSDILEEQNVPVFCQLDAVKINPLIETGAVRNVHVFSREKDSNVAGTGFYPARVALRNREIGLDAPFVNNIGYVVVLLKRHETEETMPDFVHANMSIVLTYDPENTLGVGNNEFYIPVIKADEWNFNYKKYSFWRGKGYIRVDWIEEDSAGISIYSDPDRKVSSVILRKGQTTGREIYLPGYYCRAGLNLQLEDLTLSKKSAKIYVDDDLIEVYEGESFLDDNCRVKSITLYELGGGKVEAVCRGKKLDLELKQREFTLLINNVEKEFDIGEVVEKNNNINNYLAYYGKFSQTNRENEIAGKDYAILFESKISKQEFENKGISKKISSAAQNSNKKEYREFIQDINKSVQRVASNYTIRVIVSNSRYKTFGNISSTKQNFIDPDYKDYPDGREFEEYFRKSIDSYKDIVLQYGNEKQEDHFTETFGEQALTKSELLAEYSEKERTRHEILQMFLKRYPDAKTRDEIDDEIKKLTNLNQEKAGEIINIFGIEHSIKLNSINDAPDSAVKVVVKEKDKEPRDLELKEGDSISGLSSGRKITLDTFDERGASFSYACRESEDNSKTREKRGTSHINLQQEEYINNCETNIYVQDINLQRVAKIRIIPRTFNAQTATNFSVKIGIEKRAIKLSPEKTQEIIEKLNKTIEKWEDLSKTLGEVVKTLKAVCFATAAILTVKNLFQNFGGKSVARQKVMRSPGGWFDKCEEAISSGQLNGVAVNYVSVDDCLRKNSDSIDSDVNLMHSNIKDINNRVKTMESDISSSKFGTTVVNTDASAQKNIEYLNQKYGSSNLELTDDGGKNPIKVGETIGNLNQKTWDDGNINYEQMREVELYMSKLQESEVQASPVLQEIAKKELYATLRSVKDLQDQDLIVSKAAENLQVASGKIGDPHNERKANTRPYLGLTWEDLKKNKISGVNESELDSKTPLYMLPVSGGYYLYVLNREGKGFNDKKVYFLKEQDGSYVAEESNDAPKVNFIKIDETTYVNPYKNPRVRYHETSPYKGMPAVVPFDAKNGWYAATKQTLPVFGGLKAFKDSGRVSSFWLCNVGENGGEQFNQGLGDDICTQINLDTGQPTDQFPGLSSSESVKRVQQGVRALEEAASQYRAGVKKVRVLGNSFDVGAPAADVPGTKCQDFMSPSDCHLMFNVCDPVMCPASRCNLGGKYHVEDVVQSGIVGSIFLCLPNFREGIAIPVCITGIKAGIDGLISILKAYRGCLQESLDTGKTVGVCDEIRSIYLCEFFWKQFSPVINAIIPKLAEFVYGQGTRGGGEYLSVTHAWQTTQKSVSYFTNYYAVNSMRAFKVRSTEEVGTEICKAWVSTKYPNKFKVLVEPDSPPQFHAWFQEILFNDAVVPAKSQYKVYYHIYAGKDSGTHYSIYLRQPEGSSFYEPGGRLQVAYGFVAKNEYASETKDFLAPEGYKELCIRTNFQEECGFKQVSSSFAVNYLRDMYVNEQATQEVTSEKECVSGSPSIYPVLQPNLQAGAEEAIVPEIYKRGLIRVCSTKNPGESTDPTRWKEVGFCDDVKVRCWVDTRSVQEAITPGHVGMLNQTLEDLDALDVKAKIELDGMFDQEQGKAQIEKIKEKIDSVQESVKAYKNSEKGALETIDRGVDETVEYIENITERFAFNRQKARAMFLKAEMYDEIARAIYNKNINNGTPMKITQELGETEESRDVDENIEENGKPEEDEEKTINLTFVNEDGRKVGTDNPVIIKLNEKADKCTEGVEIRVTKDNWLPDFWETNDLLGSKVSMVLIKETEVKVLSSVESETARAKVICLSDGEELGKSDRFEFTGVEEKNINNSEERNENKQNETGEGEETGEEYEEWHEDIWATNFDDEKTAWNCSESCVALPSRKAANKKVEVCSQDTGNCVITKVGDLGPWCLDDDDYVIDFYEPFADAWYGHLLHEKSGNPNCKEYKDEAGDPIPSNGAGIDLTPNIARDLFGRVENGYVKWRFID